MRTHTLIKQFKMLMFDEKRTRLYTNNLNCKKCGRKSKPPFQKIQSRFYKTNINKIISKATFIAIVRPISPNQQDTKSFICYTFFIILLLYHVFVFMIYFSFFFNVMMAQVKKLLKITIPFFTMTIVVSLSNNINLLSLSCI